MKQKSFLEELGGNIAKVLNLRSGETIQIRTAPDLPNYALVVKVKGPETANYKPASNVGGSN